MAPEYDNIEYNWADVDKEYDFEAEIDEQKKYMIEMEIERLTAQIRQAKHEMELRDAMLERKRNDDISFAKWVCERLRGRRLSIVAYEMIKEELDHCISRESSSIYPWHRRKEFIDKIRKEFIDKIEPEENFIEEDDMKL